MVNIDRYAYASKLKKTDPMLKFVFAMLTLGVCLWANSILISIIILSIMGWVAVCKGGTPFLLFVKMLLLPMSFLIISLLTIAINVSNNPEIFLVSLKMSDFWIGVSKEGLNDAALLFFKVMASVSCLYFLSLTTPMIDLLSVLRKLRVPKLMVEMMSLIYRFIFILLDTADTMYTAQSSRLGYSSIKRGYRSLGALASTLFIRSYKRSNDLYTALEARGYDGELNVLEEEFEKSNIKYAGVVLINVIFILIALYLRQYSGGLY
ncbi:cobalt transport protein CbiQ [Oxobacter pfennigii]|uniref:Cobalt transport protein CbiQ n=1 Tax=Oxobacter pfennigii TaxID=36849 RepID=A0A0P8W5W5_9CLOT|nr:cobalt ECF transporter T component CbiQ [Oxobacter pfennigii]KPU43367.1 cobalt transport protein CbiQ [Oxobacter pfennigii]